MANLTPQQATRQAVSAQWALSQLGSRDYYMLCQRFIENAYGTGGQYGSAKQASNALMWGDDFDQADVGDLVFFRPDPSNGNYGHVGIYLGNGEMVSSTNGGITRDNIQTSPYWKNLFVGFGDPPDQWQGRSSDQSLLQGAATLIQKGATAVGDRVRGQSASNVATWGGAGKYIDLIADAAEKYDIPINLLAAKVNVESGGNPTARSGAGAQGLLQLMPATARSLGVTDPNDVAQNIDAGARYFRQMYDQQGNWEDALRAYNAGPNGNWNNAETRGHVTKVMDWADKIGGSISGGGGETVATRAPQPNPYRGSDRGAGTPSGPTADDVRDMLTDILGRAPTAEEVQNAIRTSRVANPQGPSSSGRLSGSGRLPGWTGESNLQGAMGDVWSGFQSKLAEFQQKFGGAGSTGQLGGMNNTGVPNPRQPGPLSDLGGMNNTGQANPRQPGFLNGAFAGSEAARVAGGIGDAIGGLWGRSTIGQAIGGGGAPGAPGAPGGGGPGGGGVVTPEGARTEPDTSWGPPGSPTNPTAAPGQQARPKPGGWTDPNTVPEAYRGIIGQSNALLEQMDAAQEAMKNLDKNHPDYLINQKKAQEAYDNLLQRWGQMAPTVANVLQSSQKSREGEFVPGTKASQKKWTIVKRDPVTGQVTTEVIDNPNVIEDEAMSVAREQNRGSLERTRAEIASREKLSGAEIAARQGISQAEIAGRKDVATLQERGATERTELTTNTQRITTALSQAVEQRRQDIDAQIRSGDLSLREATEQFNQWYKTNVEAPIAILNQQRAAEQYKVQQHQAVTQRATAEAEHQRGLANIGQQMWTGAAGAYNQTLDRTAAAGWNEAFQNQLQGGNAPLPTLQVNESMDAFATRKVAEMLKGVSPYAASLASAEGQIGAPGQAMSGQGMADLTKQATGVVSGALANPFQMPQLPQFQMPGQVDIAGMAGAGAPDGQALTNELDQYIPSYQPQYMQ